MEDSGSVITPASGDSAATSDASDNSAATGSGAASQTTQAGAPAVDDPEFDLGGEKVKLSDYKRLREIEAKRKEMDRGANERFQQAAKMREEAAAARAEAQELVDGLSKDTKAALRKRGIDPVAFAEQTLAEALEEHSLTPEQKELREYKAREAQRKAEDDKRKETETQAQDAAQVEHYANDLSSQFIAALKPLNLPADDLPEAVARMAQRYEALMDADAPLDVQAIAEDVRDRLYAAPEHRFQSLSDEELLSQHPALVERVRKALLKQSQGTKPPAPRAPNAPQKAKKPLNRAEFEARVAQRIGA